jgi:hypothetical protein
VLEKSSLGFGAAMNAAAEPKVLDLRQQSYHEVKIIFKVYVAIYFQFWTHLTSRPTRIHVTLLTPLDSTHDVSFIWIHEPGVQVSGTCSWGSAGVRTRAIQRSCMIMHHGYASLSPISLPSLSVHRPRKSPWWSELRSYLLSRLSFHTPLPRPKYPPLQPVRNLPVDEVRPRCGQLGEHHFTRAFTIY